MRFLSPCLKGLKPRYVGALSPRRCLLAGIGPLGRPASFLLVSRRHSRPTRILTPGLCHLTGFSRLGSFSSTNQMVLGYC